MSEHLVGQVAALTEDAMLLVVVDGVEVGIARIGHEVVAYENRCPHQAGPVCMGEVIPRREAILDDRARLVGERYSTERFDIVCPWHGFAFDAASGENICDRRMRLRRWDVTVRDGQVFVSRPRR